MNVGKLWLLGAILAEVCGTTSMKLSAGFTRAAPSILMGVFYLLSLGMLTFALKHVEVGIAYAIWSGIGTLAIGMIGIFFFQEAASALKLGSMLLVILGVVGLNLAGAGH
jgi:small multidrug resistance pump